MSIRELRSLVDGLGDALAMWESRDPNAPRENDQNAARLALVTLGVLTTELTLMRADLSAQTRTYTDRV